MNIVLIFTFLNHVVGFAVSIAMYVGFWVELLIFFFVDYNCLSFFNFI